MNKEEKNSLDKLEELKNKKIDLEVINAIPDHFKDSDVVFKSCLGNPKDNKFPVYLGVTKKTGVYNLSIGLGDSYELTRDELIFLSSSIDALLKTSIKDQYGLKEEDVQGKIDMSIKSFGAPVIGKGSYSKELSEQIKKEIYDTPSSTKMEESPELKVEDIEESTIESKNEEFVTDIDGDEVDLKDLLEEVEQLKAKKQKAIEEEDESGLEEIIERMAEMAKLVSSFSDEQKKEIEKELQKKHEDALLKKSKDFEKELLGKIETEADIEYNYDYFKEIYKNHGIPMLKEEMSKVPKELQGELIAKIVEEFKEQKEEEKAN